jgi:HD-GYP domain-containing protein (c-di-GMP phosphodiesterase class II)
VTANEIDFSIEGNLMNGKKMQRAGKGGASSGSMDAALAAAKGKLSSDLNFFNIPLSSLRMDTVTGFNLYLKRSAKEAPFFYRGADLPFNEQHRAKLVEGNVDTVYIPNSERRQYLQYVEANLQDLLHDPNVPVLTKTKLLYDSANEVIEDVIRDPGSTDNVNRTRGLVDTTVTHIAEGGKHLLSMLEVMATDYRIHSHSVNVCVFGTALGKRIGLSKHELADLGLGLMLHDVGKARISRQILDKTGKLTPEEWQEIRKHPLAGVELLKQGGEIKDTVLAIVGEHHEQCSGKGYPKGLKADDIHFYAKIAILADVFDAITTNHTYKQGASTYEAIRIMQHEMAEAFNPELLRSVVLMMDGSQYITDSAA